MRVVKITEAESRTVGAGRTAVGSYCLRDTELQFGKMKRFWRWVVRMVAQ